MPRSASVTQIRAVHRSSRAPTHVRDGVKLGRTQLEQFSSGLPPAADMAGSRVMSRKCQLRTPAAPQPDSRIAANWSLFESISTNMNVLSRCTDDRKHDGKSHFGPGHFSSAGTLAAVAR